MIEAGRRWAGRLRPMVGFVGHCLSSAGAAMWSIPPHPLDPPIDGRPEPCDFDPCELDAWLERVLREAGKHD